MHHSSTLSLAGTFVPPKRAEHHRSLRAAIANVFGCRHRDLSRPFTHGQQTYLVCVRCGMRREFNLETWKPQGAFYAEIPAGEAICRHSEQRQAPVSIHSRGSNI